MPKRMTRRIAMCCTVSLHIVRFPSGRHRILVACGDNLSPEHESPPISNASSFGPKQCQAAWQLEITQLTREDSSLFAACCGEARHRIALARQAATHHKQGDHRNPHRGERTPHPRSSDFIGDTRTARTWPVSDVATASKPPVISLRRKGSRTRLEPCAQLFASRTLSEPLVASLRTKTKKNSLWSRVQLFDPKTRSWPKKHARWRDPRFVCTPNARFTECSGRPRAIYPRRQGLERRLEVARPLLVQLLARSRALAETVETGV